MPATTTSYQAITDAILAHLDNGVVPWHRPWSVPGGEPQNLLTGKPYRGLNPFLLNLARYASPYWLTFRQARTLGAHVKRGEKAAPIWFWKWWEKEDEASGETERIPILRRYYVFNVEQCAGLGDRRPELLSDERTAFERIEAAEALVAGMPDPPEIEHGRREPYYSPASDLVAMPDADCFEEREHYYSTLFHELVHATGHESRLGRQGGDAPRRFASPAYSREELVAEMGAAFLSGRAGIAHQTLEASASYLDHWIGKLSGDPKLVFQAAGAAQRAVDWIVGERAQDRAGQEAVGRAGRVAA